MCREEWLTRLMALMAPEFEQLGKPLVIEQIRVTCGFPSRRALGTKGRTIGQCWPPTASEAGRHEILISPTIADSIEVGAVLLHELIHVAVGVEAGHGPLFRKAALQLGLMGKMTATVATEGLNERLNTLINDTHMGPYPHAALDPSRMPKQSTRLVKLQCSDTRCGYGVWTTRQWIEGRGLPTCPCGNRFRKSQPSTHK
jgi:hypothetical protein